ncbi:MAG TPA: acyl-ACP--UDP-N-acetylglucosamine O-acyltransferase [Burkholderiaceae bacterium]|jgi:UDP-N-acetylglucosamine acyltransferase|nr:acyl-ACP--UDP-N-acetylglucosamine O-acyltransferase [Burkholderiaceae bacterium]
MVRIHASAIIDSRAEVADGVQIGPFSVVGPHVVIGAGTTIDSHVVITGRTRIGRDNRIFSFCSLGEIPQDKKYAGEPTELRIGDGNTIREYTSLNAGTVQGGGVTRVGSDNWIMSYVHIAHDCVIGDHTVLANLVQLAGHVDISHWAVLGGMVGVHQYVRIGAHSMVGGGSTLVQDVPPFVLCRGIPAQPFSINVEGLQRRGFDEATIAALKRAYRTLFREGLTLTQAREAIQSWVEPGSTAADALTQLNEFLGIPGRGIIR